MKTTVKAFILDNMNDVTFEKVLNNFIINSLDYANADDVLMHKMTTHLDALSTKSEDVTFATLNEIKEMSGYYIANHHDEFLPTGLSDLNDTTNKWEMTAWIPEEERELSVEKELDLMGASGGVKDLKCFFAHYPELKSEQGNFFFDQIKFPYAFGTSHNRPLRLDPVEFYDVNEDNYLDYIEHEKKPLALGLANFLYEVLHYNVKDESKSPQFEEFASEKSLVKLVKEDNKSFGYAVHFLLDTRTRYIAKETHAKYADRYDGESLEVIAPNFFDFDSVYEDLSSFVEKRYIMEPFTHYLNEELIITELSEEEVYQVLEQLVTLLVVQGFTKSEQIEMLEYENENYEGIVKNSHMI